MEVLVVKPEWIFDKIAMFGLRLAGSFGAVSVGLEIVSYVESRRGYLNVV
jgi:hypothetical protein